MWRRRQRRGSRGEEPATERRKWRAKSWGSIMFQPVSIAKKIQESGNRFFRFVMNPCFRVRLSSPYLNFRSQLPDFSRVLNRFQERKFVMRDCFVNREGIQYLSDVNITFSNDEFNVSGGSPPTPAPTAAHSLPIKSQHTKVIMRNWFNNVNGIQYIKNVNIIFPMVLNSSQHTKVIMRNWFNNVNGIQYIKNVNIIFYNQDGHCSEFHVPDTVAQSGSTADFLAPTLTSPWPTPVGQSQSIKMNESCHRLCNKFSPSRSKTNPFLALIVLSIAVLRYLIHHRIVHSVNDAYALLQWYASFYPFMTADTILRHKERRAIKREHELKVSKPVSGDGDGTRGPESVREHHRMIQERVSAVISNAPYLLNVDCDSFINKSKAFFEAKYFSMDRKRHDRYSSRNVMLLDININGLDGNQGPPIYVGIGCSLRRRPTIDMMPLLWKNPPKKTCNCWPKWCYLYCRSRIKNRKVKSIPRKIQWKYMHSKKILKVG